MNTVLPFVAIFAPYIMKLVESIIQVCATKPEAKAQPRTPEELEKYPRPAFLPSGGVHWAVVGVSGVGKSSFVNAVRGVKPGDPGAAKTGLTETTMQPTKFVFPGHPEISFWDLPGGSTDTFNADSYTKDFGLRHFHGLIVVADNRWQSLQTEIVNVACHFNIPYYVVRSKLDQAVESGKADHGWDEATTSKNLRFELAKTIKEQCHSFSSSRLYLLSSRIKEMGDWHKFYQDVLADLM